MQPVSSVRMEDNQTLRISSQKTTRKNINDNERVRNVINENTNEKTNMNPGRHYEYEVDTINVINKNENTTNVIPVKTA